MDHQKAMELTKNESEIQRERDRHRDRDRETFKQQVDTGSGILS